MLICDSMKHVSCITHKRVTLLRLIICWLPTVLQDICTSDFSTKRSLSRCHKAAGSLCLHPASITSSLSWKTCRLGCSPTVSDLGMSPFTSSQGSHSIVVGRYISVINCALPACCPVYSVCLVQIWMQTKGRVSHFVAGGSTGGTISGTGRFLKDMNPKIKVMLPDPVGSVFWDFWANRKAEKDLEAKSYQVYALLRLLMRNNMFCH